MRILHGHTAIASSPAFEDHSGHRGARPGPLLDGPINLFAKTLDDLITSTVLPVDDNDDGEVDPVFRRIFGVAPRTPWAIYRDGNQSGIIESNYQQHKGPTKTIMTGGRSPKLVNDLQTFAIRYGISQIAQAIYSSMPGVPAELPARRRPRELYTRASSTTCCSPGCATQIRSAPWQLAIGLPGMVRAARAPRRTPCQRVLNLRTGEFQETCIPVVSRPRSAMRCRTSSTYDIMLDRRSGLGGRRHPVCRPGVSAIGYEYDRGSRSPTRVDRRRHRAAGSVRAGHQGVAGGVHHRRDGGRGGMAVQLT